MKKHPNNKNHPEPDRLLAAKAKPTLPNGNKHEREALRALRCTIAAHPSDTVTYYHLARLHDDGHRPEEALASLEQFFANAANGSLTSPKLLSSAFSLCDRVQHALAVKNQEAASKAVQGLRQHVEGLTGYPVVVAYEEMPEDRDAEVTTAWASGGGQHLIRCNRSVPPALQPHLLARQLMRIELVAQSRRAGEIRHFVTTPANAPCQLRLLRLRRPHIRRLLKQGWVPKTIAHAAGEQMNCLLEVLFLRPLELVIETRLRTRLPVLRPAQFLNLAESLAEQPDPAVLLAQEQILPRALVRAGLALNCVKAILHDSLFPSTSRFHSAYSETEIYPLAKRVWDCWQAAAPSFVPGDEHRLVDAFADVLGLRGCYEWALDPCSSSSEGNSPEIGQTQSLS